MKKIIEIFIVLSLILPVTLFAGEAEDRIEIEKVVLNYVDGWWEGDAEKMDRALHPDLVKRSIYVDRETGKSMINNLSKSQMVGYTLAGGGRDKPEDKGEVEVVILGINKNVATVEATSEKFLDYIHLAKWNGEWKIINVLWDWK